MAYLTYTQKFQDDVIKCKEEGLPIKDILEVYQISAYMLYKIIHLNNRLPIPSEASEGNGSEEHVEYSEMSPNNNSHHERPASTNFRYNSEWYKNFKI